METEQSTADPNAGNVLGQPAPAPAADPAGAATPAGFAALRDELIQAVNAQFTQIEEAYGLHLSGYKESIKRVSERLERLEGAEANGSAPAGNLEARVAAIEDYMRRANLS